MTSVYKKLDNHFQDVRAYTVLDSVTGEHVGRVLFKWTKAGVCYAYVQEWGFAMVAGKAGGYGYDKQGAALHDAFYNVAKDNELQGSKLLMLLDKVTYNGEWMTVLKDNGYNLLNVI